MIKIVLPRGRDRNLFAKKTYEREVQMLKKALSLLPIIGLLLLAGSSNLLAQSQNQDTQDVTFQVQLFEWYDLYIAQTTITFTDRPPTVGNPPTNVSIAANENPVDVRVFAIILPGDTLSLTVKANGDLKKGSGSDIGIDAISWTATGDGYQAGTMSTSTDVTAGTWTSAIFHWHTGTFSYFFARDYQNQEPGTYTATATYTLSSI